jgi:hypothetical protein
VPAAGVGEHDAIVQPTPTETTMTITPRFF